MHDFSEDCVLLVLASEHYDETDYIRTLSEFQADKGLKMKDFNLKAAIQFIFG